MRERKKIKQNKNVQERMGWDENEDDTLDEWTMIEIGIFLERERERKR